MATRYVQRVHFISEFFVCLKVTCAILQQVISYTGYVSHGPTYGGLPLIRYSFMDA
jgi:hypothetical protein